MSAVIYAHQRSSQLFPSWPRAEIRSHSAARLGLLMRPDMTGLPAFLADGPPGSSGLMINEYVVLDLSADHTDRPPGTDPVTAAGLLPALAELLTAEI